MKRYFTLLISSGALLLSSVFSNAEPSLDADLSVPIDPCPGNWYVAAGGSIAWHNHQRFTFNMRGEDFYFSREYKRHWGGNFAIGYLIRGLDCVNIRAEGEFLYREHPLRRGNFKVYGHHKKSFSKTLHLHGHSKDAAVMGNILAELPFPFASCLDFYFGVGLGASYNRLTIRPSKDYNIRPPFSRNSWLVAAQLLAGLSYQWTPSMAVTLGYRLFSTGEVLTEKNLLRSSNRPVIQSIDLGLRFNFN